MSALRRLVATSLILGALLPSSPSHAADVTVSAAASLRDAFTEIAREFERANPQHRVLLNIGASGQLLQQIARGAPVDVFAAADQDTTPRSPATSSRRCRRVKWSAGRSCSGPCLSGQRCRRW